MQAQMNGWMVLRDILCLVLLLGFCMFIIHIQIPAVAAQIGANEKLVAQVNQAFGNMSQTIETRFVRLETKVGLDTPPRK